uniref:Uncharacterized protein n=1 Tax=Siphoviridae sp. ctcx61 TaxID=2825575 RepID=A0A8S5TWP3_9CAUD|nr:MAG TPA: hypothetical protein [Siphoviridae sp. ctcx61]
MRFNILGFDQVKAVENKLTIEELMILRHMHDFVSSGRMESIIKDGEMYYWIKYDKFIDDLPILNMKKTRLMEIFNNNLCEKPLDWEARYNGMSESSKKRAKSFKFTGMLKSYTKKDKTGTYSYFTFTKKFYDMLPNITDNDMDNKKASTVPPVKANKENIKSNNSIPQNNKEYASKKEENKVLNNKHNNTVKNTFTEYDADELEKKLQKSQEERLGYSQFNPSFELKQNNVQDKH